MKNRSRSTVALLLFAAATIGVARAQVAPMNYSDLESMPITFTISAGPNIRGTAFSLVQVFKDQEDKRRIAAAARKPEHHSLLPRPRLRQETTAEATPAASGSAPLATPAPVAPAAPEAQPIVTLVGSYRPAEMVAWVRSIAGEFRECPGLSPFCGRLSFERPGGANWVLPAKTIVAKAGYVLEGYDANGPECGAFRLTYEPQKAGADGVAHVKFGLAPNPTWSILEAADCTMTLYEIPRSAVPG
jgi:hypothetical protein